jgi:predicted nucleic acid-binding protein
MKDLLNARLRCLQNNIDRYCGLLATDLTEIERDYIHTRIAQERTELERLLEARSRSTGAPDAFIAAQALNKRGRNHSEA